MLPAHTGCDASTSSVSQTSALTASITYLPMTKADYMDPNHLTASSVSSVDMLNGDKGVTDEQQVAGEEEDQINQRIFLHIYDYEAKKFSSITNYDGLVRIYNSHTWASRIFWIAVVLTALILFIIYSGTLLWSYHQRPTQFQVNIVVPKEGILFPDMTICNFNPVVQSKVAAWNMSDEVLKYVLKSYMEVSSLQDTVESNLQIKREHDMFVNYTIAYKQSTGQDFDLLTFFNSTGHTCRDMVLACSWAGKEVDNCCNFAQHIMTSLGKCIRFSNLGNAEMMQYQKISGAHYGLYILLDILTIERTNVASSHVNAGVQFFIHPEGVLPFLQSSGVAAPPGQKLYGAVSLRNITLLPKEQWGFCTDEWNDGVHGEQLIDQQYSASHCEANCIANAFKKKCGCVPISKQFSGSQKVCTPLELYNCTKSDDTDLEGGVDDEIYWYSSCGFGVECNRLEYNIEASYSAIIIEHPRFQNQSSQTHQNTSYILENYLALNVFMKEIAYEENIQMKQMQTVDLLSNIACGASLFLGLSTVSLFEILIFMIKSVWGAMNTDRQKHFEDKERKLRKAINAKATAATTAADANTDKSSSKASSGSANTKENLDTNEDMSRSPRLMGRRPTRTLVIERRPSNRVNAIERQPTPNDYDWQQLRTNEEINPSNNDIHLSIFNGPTSNYGRARSRSTLSA
uniref:Uncharacterized protein n=1 Tax=Plectus sambesii TaxID=2011161 RepID=A0A914VGN3_9BILA